jgi:hypothetical protein
MFNKNSNILEEKKAPLFEELKDFNSLTNYCDYLLQSYNKNNLLSSYSDLLVCLFAMKIIYPVYNELYKSLSLENFEKDYKKEINNIKTFTKAMVRETENKILEIDYKREEEIKKAINIKMKIDNAIFPDLFPKPENNIEYQNNKKIAETQRKKVNDDFDKNYSK